MPSACSFKRIWPELAQKLWLLSLPGLQLTVDIIIEFSFFRGNSRVVGHRRTHVRHRACLLTQRPLAEFRPVISFWWNFIYSPSLIQLSDPLRVFADYSRGTIWYISNSAGVPESSSYYKPHAGSLETLFSPNTLP